MYDSSKIPAGAVAAWTGLVCLGLLVACSNQSPEAETAPAIETPPETAPEREVQSPDLARAALLAQSTLRELGLAMSGRDDTVAYVAIKMAFHEGAAEEWLWVNDLTYDGHLFRGRVGNAPQRVTTVQLGDEVEVAPGEICDWMVVTHDGELRGGYTIRVEVEAMSAEERESFLATSGLIL